MTWKSASDRPFPDVEAFAARLRKLHEQRKANKRKAKREALTKAERDKILKKTRRRCHICGGVINRRKNDWQADHVLAHSMGGKHRVDNYLAAHSVCNNYRWHYEAEEFQWILKLDVFMRTQIAKETPIGRDTGKKFVEHEHRRAGRRKPRLRLRSPRSPPPGS